MVSSVSFSVLSVSVQRIIKWDPLNYKTQISLALFLRTYTQPSEVLWWRQPIMIPFQSKEALIDEQIRSVQANFQN
ncbi:BnaAnng36940D [Brassica napus]|uniref:BnaAnng36940D protein n=1 Tax=Brassica napus TaxID=3708 RepID=A0A078CRK6_BRANA|nr:BnaAnng36940D [Brassica napus]